MCNLKRIVSVTLFYKTYERGNVNLNLSYCICVMKLLSLYLVVSATTLVQTFPSAETSFYANPRQGYSGMAFPQSKDSIIPKRFNDVGTALDRLRERKRDAVRKRFHRPRPKQTQRKQPFMAPQWDGWTDWSACSVSCGKGREIRWRHCLHNCAAAETEMEEKSCQLPACGRKLFGFIQL